jgi:hypothetical protein
MNTKILFNTDRKLKDAAQKKARERGLTLTAFLNIDVIGQDIARARDEIRAGKGISVEVEYRRPGTKKIIYARHLRADCGRAA